MTDKDYVEKVCSEIHLQSASNATIIKPVVDEALDNRHGSFNSDKAGQISDAKMQMGRLFLTVHWLKRKDGATPEPTIYTNSELKRHSPLLLCEFYERMLRVNLKSSMTSMAAPGGCDEPSMQE